MILCQEPAEGFGKVDKVDKFVFFALPCFFIVVFVSVQTSLGTRILRISRMYADTFISDC